MTALAVFIEPTRALVCVDTESVRADGSRGQCSKTVHLPHINVMLCGRGNLELLNALSGLGANRATGFDALTDDMPRMLMLADCWMVSAAASGGLTVPEEQHLVAVGWSERAQRMYGRHWQQHSRSRGFIECQPIDEGWLFAPELPSEAAHLEPQTIDELVATHAHQVRRLRAWKPAVSAGGETIVADLRRWCSATQRIAGSTGELAAKDAAIAWTH